MEADRPVEEPGDEDAATCGAVEQEAGSSQHPRLQAGDFPDPEDVRRTLGTVASGLAEQLKTINEEMIKIRSELYGEAGIGGLSKELEKLGASGLASSLGLGNAKVPSPSGRKTRGSAGGEAAGRGQSSSGTGSEVRSRMSGLEQDLDEMVNTKRREEMEAMKAKMLRRKLEKKNMAPSKTSERSIADILTLLVMMFIGLYVFSGDFRTMIAEFVFGPDFQDGSELWD